VDGFVRTNRERSWLHLGKVNDLI